MEKKYRLDESQGSVDDVAADYGDVIALNAALYSGPPICAPIDVSARSRTTASGFASDKVEESVVPDPPIILAIGPDNGAPFAATTSDILNLIGTGEAGAVVTIYANGVRIGNAAVNSRGVWRITSAPATGALQIITATQFYDGKLSGASIAASIHLAADLGNFSSNTDNWSNPILVDGSKFYDENADVNGSAPWALTEVDTHTLQFELRPGDTWPDSGSHRTEIADATKYGPDATVETSYQFMVAPGATNQYWTVLGQFHSNDESPITERMNPDYPVFAFELTGKGGEGQGDYLAVWASYAPKGATVPTAITPNGGASFGWLYVAPKPITRGIYNSMKIEARFENTSRGFLEVWVNGTRIVNYQGPIGYGASNYWKEGIYQDPDASGETLIADYRNLLIGDKPLAPVIVHAKLSGSTLQISGEAEAFSTVTIYDGAKIVGSTTARSGGWWSFSGVTSLSGGTYNLTARDSDAAGHASARSNVFAVTSRAVTDVERESAERTSVLSDFEHSAYGSDWVAKALSPHSIASLLGIHDAPSEIADVSVGNRLCVPFPHSTGSLATM